METTHRHNYPDPSTSQLPPSPGLETIQPLQNLSPPSGTKPSEPYIRRVTEIYKDRQPSGFEEMRQADRELESRTRPQSVPFREKRTWKDKKWHDLLVYVSLVVSVIALIGTGHHRGLWVDAARNVTQPMGPNQTCEPLLGHRYHRFPYFPYSTFLPIPPKLARAGLAVGIDIFDMPNKTRWAVEIGEGKWLVAVPTREGNDGRRGWGDENVGVKFAASVVDVGEMAGVHDVATRGGDLDLQDVLLANAWYSQIYQPTHSPSTHTTTSTAIATLTVTSTLTTTSTATFSNPTFDAQSRSILHARLAEHELDLERSRRDWRRREKELMRRETSLAVREEEVRRREKWVLGEIRQMTRTTGQAADQLTGIPLVDKDT